MGGRGLVLGAGGVLGAAWTIGALAALQDEGKIRQFGVSNFPAGHLRRALEHGAVFADQVEYHPFLAQEALLALGRERDVLVTAYAPLAQGKVTRDPVIREIADAHDRTPGQVALRWLLDQPHVAAIPKASSAKHLAANLDVFDFELSADERSAIDDLQRGGRTIDPSWAPDWD